MESVARRRPLAERFEEKVDRSGGPDACHLWTAQRNHSGYGTINEGGQRGRPLPAHRVAWMIVHGTIPPGMFVCHKCDNPPCVNVAHLFVGTPRDNTLDMFAKGRAAGRVLIPKIKKGLPRGDEHYSRREPWRLARGERSASHLYPELRRGERNGLSKLTEDKVREIRRRASEGERHTALAAEFGVTGTLIGYVVHRKTWRHVT